MTKTQEKQCSYIIEHCKLDNYKEEKADLVRNRCNRVKSTNWFAVAKEDEEEAKTQQTLTDVPSNLEGKKCQENSDIDSQHYYHSHVTNHLTTADKLSLKYRNGSSNSTNTTTSSTTRTPSSTAIVLLNFVAIIWGSQHAIIKSIIIVNDDINSVHNDSSSNNNVAAAFTFVRFALAATLALPYLPGWKQIISIITTATLTIQSRICGNQPHANSNKVKLDDDLDSHFLDINDDNPCANAFSTTKNIVSNGTLNQNDNRIGDAADDDEDSIAKAWRWGTELGLWMFLGFAFQAIGLLTTTAQRSGFLLYLNVKFVPLFAFLLFGRHISTSTWISALSAFTGTALLALDGQSSVGLNVGDGWSVLAAMASAMFILRLEQASQDVPQSSQLNATSLLVVTTLSGIWLLGQLYQQQLLLLSSSSSSTTTEESMMIVGWFTLVQTVFINTVRSHPWEILYLGAISTALSNYLQTKAQKEVPAEQASIIYSLDPVYGAIFSYCLLGETLGGIPSYIGVAMILVAAATAAATTNMHSSNNDHPKPPSSS